MQDEQLTRNSYDRFKSVESVANQIFDKMPDLTGEDLANQEELKSELDKFGLDLSSILPFFNSDTKGGDSIISKTENLLTSLRLVLEERNTAALRVAAGESGNQSAAKAAEVDFARAPDISYYAAQERAQLPRGVEILKGKPSMPPDQVMLTTVRQMIDQQEREFKEVRIAEKRQFNRQVLPSLESQEELEPKPDPQAQYVRPTLKARVFARLKRAFWSEYFLAISLSGWSTLAMMVFIDPDLSTALCFFSVFLLFVSFCMFTDEDQSE